MSDGLLYIYLYVDSMRKIEVIDVLTQEEDGTMLLHEWTDYYNSVTKERILNVISLEFSGTK